MELTSLNETHRAGHPEQFQSNARPNQSNIRPEHSNDTWSNPLSTAIGDMEDCSPRFQEPSGGGNNSLFPLLGKAKERCAHSDQNRTTISSCGLPEPGLVFDTLLMRHHV